MHEKKDKKYFYSQNLFQLKESFQVPSTRKGEWRISVEGTKKEQEEFACLLIHPARCGGEQRRKEGGVAEGPIFKFEFDLELGERAKNIEVETAAYVVKSPKVRTIDLKIKDQRHTRPPRAPSARRGKNKDQRPTRPPRAPSARRGKARPKAKCQGEGQGGLLFHDSKTKVEKDSDAGLQLEGRRSGERCSKRS